MSNTYRIPPSDTLATQALATRGRAQPQAGGIGGARVTQYAEVSQNYYFDTGDTAYPNRYYLELIEGADVSKRIDAIECPFVNSVFQKNQSAVERTWTFDGLYEEHKGFRQREFTITGRSCADTRDLERFRKFCNFIEKYEQLSAENKNAFTRARDIRLVLNFPFEGASYYCTLMDFNLPRDTGTSRMSFTYQIRFLTYGFATRKWQLPTVIVQYLDRPGDNEDHTGHGHPCHHSALLALSHAPPDTAPIYSAQTDVSNQVTAIRGGSTIQGGVASATRPAMLNPSFTGKAARDVPSNKALWHVARNAEASTYLRWDDLEFGARALERARFVLVENWYTELRVQAELAIGVQFDSVHAEIDVAVLSDSVEIVVGGNAGPAGFAFAYGLTSTRPHVAQPTPPTAVPFFPQPVVSVTATSADTSLADIAARACGDRNAWPAIMRLNGWRDARYGPTGAPLSPGSVILVPAPAGVPAPTNDDLYGTDLLLRDGDLVAVGTTGIATITGLPNLEQNLDHRMRTERGANGAYPAFGLQPIIGESTASDTLGLLLSDIKGQVIADHRVARLASANVRQDHDKFYVDFEAEAITRARARASYPVPGAL